ncbi:MAG TPA: alpha/beta fold hydrolase, partial [Ktedonobacteraceae bacterium]|nr:alpha/beta fold hydrolase [Ktedonobacteraceae bacterium]
MIPAHETFDGTFPFQPHFTTAPGFRMHYVDEGQGEPILCLHGEPTWGYLYRHFIPPLARHHRVIVPDHMGFGKSETPQDRSYLLDEHVDNLEALVLSLDLRDITLVLHDWGGPIGGGFALRHPDRVKRLFLMNTLIGVGTPAEAEHLPRNNQESHWFRWARQAYENGTFEQILGNANHTIVHLMLELQGIEHTSVVNPTWIRAYASHFQTKEECRGVIRFPQQIIAPDPNVPVRQPDPAAIAALRQKPIMLAEGMHDRALLPEHFIPVFQAGFPG